MWSSIEVRMMTLLTFAVGVSSDCCIVDWSVSFLKRGLSECDNLGHVIAELCRSDPTVGNDDINKLDGALCCSKPAPWTEGYVFKEENWWYSMDRNTWSNCTPGYFLTGFYRTYVNSALWNIEEGRCTKAPNHPNVYGGCYEQDISKCFDKKGCCGCSEGSYITGVYRETCSDLRCLTKLRCCKMADRP